MTRGGKVLIWLLLSTYLRMQKYAQLTEKTLTTMTFSQDMDLFKNLMTKILSMLCLNCERTTLI